jgi:phosphoglycerate dehydrogenase-like enzyme
MTDPTRPAIAVLDDYQQVAESCADWSSLAADTVFFHDHVDDVDRLALRLRPCAAIVAIRERTPIGRELIERLPNLRLIVTIGTWNAAIDVAAATARGVVVCGTAGGGPAATAELTWALVLALARNLPREVGAVRAGGWQTGDWQTGVGLTLEGRVLGLLGVGRIGRVVARYGAAFGMRVIAWSQNLTAAAAREVGVERVEKADLFRSADVVSIHLKLGERTRGLVGAPELALMKPTAFLVNSSRGPIVDEAALIAALSRRAIAGAGLDVFDREPLPDAHPFRALPNVIATPHVGYVTREVYGQAFPQIVEDIGAWLRGTPIRVLAA